ncbi:hypothetical protein [Salinigranum salinum]|uniref:hypothetical protein n=1 Tax=Salinigranum salinum TaxID=1364937 RepID=UPI001260EDBC|nr:hypothetical protein [Salinigranum salinum]
MTSESIGESNVSTLSKVRGVAFSLVAVVTLILPGVMLGGELLLAFTGWTTDMGTHQVHDMISFPMLWLALLIPVATLLYRPKRRVTTVLAPLVFLAPLVVFALAADSPILMLPLIFGVLGLVLVALHPAGRSVLRLDRVERLNRLLAGLVVVAAVPLLVFAGDQILRQVTLADDHVLFVHYGAMAAGAVYIVLMAALATVRERDWRFAAWSAGAVAVLLGATSLAFTVESSAGPLWGALAVAWGVAFVGVAEYTRRPVVETTPSQPDTPQPM